MYRFTIRHVPGAKNVCSDTYSRSAVKSVVSSSCDGIRQTVSLTDTSALAFRDKIIHSYVLAAMTDSGYSSGIDITAITFERVQDAVESDLSSRQLLEMIHNGFPSEKHQLAHPCIPISPFDTTCHPTEVCPCIMTEWRFLHRCVAKCWSACTQHIRAPLA